MKSVLLLILGLSIYSAPSQAQWMSVCIGEDPEVSMIDVIFVNSKDVPDIYNGSLDECQNTSSQTDTTVTFPANGTTLNDANGKPFTKWLAAVVTGSEGKKTIFYQFSDFLSRARGCKQGLFMSDSREILDIKINEPKRGSGTATINGEIFKLNCSN